MRYFGAGKLTDESVEAAGGDSSQWATWKPSAPPAVTVEQSWATPGAAVERVPESGGGFFDKLFGVLDKGVGITGRVVDIFGRPVPQQPMGPPPPAPGVPVWVYVAIPVVVVGAVVLMRRKPRAAVAGYRRHRRSRR